MIAPRGDRRKYVCAALRFDVILRFALLTNASVTVALAWLVPNSLTAMLLAQGGKQGEAVSTMMLLLVLLAWADLLINDIAPAKFTFRCAGSRRHLIYSVLAAVYFVQAFASIGPTFDATDVLSLGYMVSGLVCAWYSFAVALKGGYE